MFCTVIFIGRKAASRKQQMYKTAWEKSAQGMDWFDDRQKQKLLRKNVVWPTMLFVAIVLPVVYLVIRKTAEGRNDKEWWTRFAVEQLDFISCF